MNKIIIPPVYVITINADSHVEFVVILIFIVKVRDTAVNRIVMVVGFFCLTIRVSNTEVKFVSLVIFY